MLEVEDSGPGVRREDESKLFQPFFTTKPIGEGTGLGLSVSYGIVRSYGGTIGYRRGDLGGALFYFELPIAAQTHNDGVDDRRASTTPIRCLHATFDATVVSRRTRLSDRLDPSSCSITPRSIRRRAASRSTRGSSAARASSTSSIATTATIAHVVEKRLAPGTVVHGDDRLAAPASITCSSTPASTCCRPRSIGCTTSAR